MSLPVDFLADIASGLASGGEWCEHARIDPEHRYHHRLLGTDLYEAWLLGWAPGQHVGMHDHGDAAGAFVVVEGKLVEELPHRRRSFHTLGAGDTGVIRPGDLHDVGNSSASTALSIHVYSPPLSTMTFYDAAGLTPLHTEVVEAGVLLG